MTREEAIEAIKCNWPDRRYTILREALDMAISALRQQEPNDWICTLKCTALMDEGMCSHGGLCCLYESQRTIKKSEPLAPDELLKMDGEPVWVEFQDGSGGCWGLVHITTFNYIVFANGLFCTIGNPYYGKTWLAYRQKPEEGTL